MIWSRALVCLIAVISLLPGAIWPNSAAAATAAPAIVPLGSIDAGLSIPGKLDVDAAGNLYVADIRANRVLKLAPSGRLLRVYDAVAASGRGLAVSADGGRLYVAAADQVAILDGHTGEIAGTLGGAVPLAGAGAIDLDAAGNVYVVDTAAVKVKVYDADGAYLREFVGYGTVNGKFKSIDSMSVNAGTGEVYVSGMQTSPSEGGYDTVQIFSLAGLYSGRIALVGSYISDCRGIAFDDAGREYYLDKLTGKLHVRPRTSGFSPVVLDLGGSGDGQVLMPWDIAFDVLTGRLFVASDSGEIEIFGVDGGVTPVSNQAPGLPGPINPIANSEVATVRPQLHFANAADPEGDILVYDVRISGTPNLNYTETEGAGGETVVQVDTDLVENALYSWQVMAKDGENDSGWTQAQSFYVNAVEEAPSAPVLSTALAGEALAGADRLSWQASVDNDPLESIGYRLEIATDATFAEPFLSEPVAGTDIALGELAGYASLVPGDSYFWRVVAVDAHGLESVSAETGRFRYDTAVLTVRANLPSAKVYLAGNAAYSGAYLGTTPLELRDLAPGPYTVVVERAGCESFIAQVELGASGGVTVYADLMLAVRPELKKASDLRSVKTQLKSAALVAPFIVDFDNDDMADLLVGDEDGAVNLFRALAQRGAKVQFGAPESLDFGQLPGTSLFVVDWNNDNKKDVLVGAADGTVSIYRQPAASSDLSPVFDLALFLRDGKGAVIDVGSQANPAVIDIDDDGDKDLVVGTGNGKVYLYLNIGSDEAPELAIDPVTLVSFGSGSASPLFVDWDADGTRDLLVANNGNLLRCQPRDDGTYEVADILVNSADSGFAAGARYFVADTDGGQGKDVYIGQADGLVQVMRSAGKELLPSATAALLDKLAQVDALAAEAGIELTEEAGAVTVGIESGDFNAAAHAAKELIASCPADTDLYRAADELQALLNR